MKNFLRPRDKQASKAAADKGLDKANVSKNQPLSQQSVVPVQRRVNKMVQLKNSESLPSASFPARDQFSEIVQRKILVGDDWHVHYDDTFVEGQVDATRPFIEQWGELTASVFKKANNGQTRRAIEDYFSGQFELDIRALLRLYNEKKSFENSQELTRQLVQDVKLKLLGMSSILGVDQMDGQYSEKDDDPDVGRTGKSKPFKIYRTMKASDWDTYVGSGDPKDILHGHGGSLGQALHYFLKSKKDNKPDVLVEIAFTPTASNMFDYKEIEHGGEGKGPKGGKLTGKKEKNDVMDIDEKIFSVNLSKSKDRITELNPKIKVLDRV